MFDEIIKPENAVKIGVVGLGMGFDHIEFMEQAGGFDVTAISDFDAQKVKKAQKYLEQHGRPEPEVFESFDALIDAHVCDAVCLALPIPMNAEYAAKALNAGYHVLSEKPIALNLKEAAFLKKAVEGSGKVYQVGFELRHSPLVQTVMDYIGRGMIGKVSGITYNYVRKPDHSHRKWAGDEDGGSVLFDCLSHSFDLMNLFAGSVFEKIAAFCSKNSQLVMDDPDIGSMAIEYQNGVHASMFFCEFCGQPYSSLMQIIGDDGKMFIDPANAGEFTLYWGKGKHETKVSINPESTCPGHLGMGEEHIEFKNAIEENRQPYSDFKVGLESLFLSIAATRSFKEDRIVFKSELLDEYNSFAN